ncbi:MAG: hypothetical protein AUJ01_01500 [Acidobacteria bacterium 13_1_40CM_3_65_5]|nr:MAG: hypothetical protein AUJ01_01500 [Acidobacteria bacterium 13_1_40CM_3_65_5]
MLAVLLALIAQDSVPQLSFRLTVPNDRSAYLVELQIANPPNPSRLVIPAWAPGAYRLMNSGENISGFAASSAEGHLPARQDSPNSWVIDTHGKASITVRYSASLRDSVVWRRPNNRWFLRTTSGMVDGPRTFMYLDGWKQLPARVTFQVPLGWRIATGLAPATIDSTTYTAPNYDVLIDAPMLLDHFLSYPFTAAGTPTCCGALRRRRSAFSARRHTRTTRTSLSEVEAADSSTSIQRRSASEPKHSRAIHVVPRRSARTSSSTCGM